MNTTKYAVKVTCKYATHESSNLITSTGRLIPTWVLPLQVSEDLPEKEQEYVDLIEDLLLFDTEEAANQYVITQLDFYSLSVVPVRLVATLLRASRG